MSTKSWREHAAPIIALVIEANRGKSLKEVKAAVKSAYPFGPKQYHPYKIWRSEVKRQLAEEFPAPAKIVNESELPLWKS